MVSVTGSCGGDGKGEGGCDHKLHRMTKLATTDVCMQCLCVCGGGGAYHIR